MKKEKSLVIKSENKENDEKCRIAIEKYKKRPWKINRESFYEAWARHYPK